MQKKRVLIIDDDAKFLELVQDSLKDTPSIQLETRQIFSGFDVIDDVIQCRPDILFLDVKLPDVSGALLSSLLKGDSVALQFPIYLISAWKEEELRELTKEMDVAGFIHKSKFIEQFQSILVKHFGEPILKKEI